MFDVIVVGAGPSGLSCAIEAVKANLSVVILEKGGLVDSIRRFPTNLVWFSTPELLEIGDVPFSVSTVRPTRVDTLNYYQRVARHYALDIRYFDAVTSVVQENGTFRVITNCGRLYEGRNVVLATGYFDQPNRLNVPGESLPKVFHYYHEPFQYFDCNVAVVGGRNSAVEAALDLYRHGSRVTLIHRGQKLSDGVKYWILPDIDNRIRAGEVKAIFAATVLEIQGKSIVLQTPEGVRTLDNDFTFVLIGFQPDTTWLQQCGIKIDPDTLAPEIAQDTFETNVPGLFVAGSLVAGRNTNRIFIENGRTHGRVIIASIRSRG